MPVSVWIIEDDAELRRTLAELLGRSPGLRCTANFATADEAIACLTEPLPDVILLDLRLPGMSGIEFLRHVKTRHPSLRVLTYTQYADDAMVVDAIRAGADGYALKRAGLGQIEAGIHAVHRGEGFFPPSIARKLAAFVREAPPPPRTTDDHGLTEREVELLRLARQGLDSKAIAEALGCAYATVRTHFDHIRAKLKVGSRAEAVAKYFRL
jgi:DNA-binding NarL/FixJ family response regulator